jgi:hypothetical protein
VQGASADQGIAIIGVDVEYDHSVLIRRIRGDDRLRNGVVVDDVCTGGEVHVEIHPLGDHRIGKHVLEVDIKPQ